MRMARPNVITMTKPSRRRCGGRASAGWEVAVEPAEQAARHPLGGGVLRRDLLGAVRRRQDGAQPLLERGPVPGPAVEELGGEDLVEEELRRRLEGVLEVAARPV